jgi:hypothetical protein
MWAARLPACAQAYRAQWPPPPGGAVLHQCYCRVLHQCCPPAQPAGSAPRALPLAAGCTARRPTSWCRASYSSRVRGRRHVAAGEETCMHILLQTCMHILLQHCSVLRSLAALSCNAQVEASARHCATAPHVIDAAERMTPSISWPHHPPARQHVRCGHLPALASCFAHPCHTYWHLLQAPTWPAPATPTPLKRR